MTSAGYLALVITVFGALSYGAASILQAVAARRSTSTVQTLRHPLYLAGIGCDMLAWVGSMIALRELAVYLVESILAGSLAVTVVAARLILKSRLRRRDVAAVLVTLTALTALALSAGPQDTVPVSAALRWGFCGAALIVVLLGWTAVKTNAPAGVVAALGGLCLGGAALAGRALPMDDLLTEPLVAVLLVFAAGGMMLYANALQRGEVGPVTAVHWTAEVLAPSIVALLLLGDVVRPGWELTAAIAGLIAVGSAVVLATAPATRAAALPAEAFAATHAFQAAPSAYAASFPARSSRHAPPPDVYATNGGTRAADLGAAHPDLAAALYRTVAPLPPASPALALPAPAPLSDAPTSPAPAPLARVSPQPGRVAPAAAMPRPGNDHAERVIWWGPPPVWKPPARPQPALPAAPGSPAEVDAPTPSGPDLLEPDPVPAMLGPGPWVPDPAVADRLPSSPSRPRRPWDDL